MITKRSIVAGTILVLLSSLGAQAKRQPPERGMLVKMESMECGVHQQGLSGLGSITASVGVTKMSSDDKLCPQYLVRTDTMEYHIRPLDKKHPTVLPVGHEAQFQIRKDRMFLLMEDLDKKVRQYQVVSEKPLSAESASQEGGERSER